jgi:hypothetical protein
VGVILIMECRPIQLLDPSCQFTDLFQPAGPRDPVDDGDNRRRRAVSKGDCHAAIADCGSKSDTMFIDFPSVAFAISTKRCRLAGLHDRHQSGMKLFHRRRHLRRDGGSAQSKSEEWR